MIYDAFRFLIVGAALAFTSVAGSISAAKEPFIAEWFLIRLEKGLDGPRADGTFMRTTGNAELDATILAEGIHRIEYALPASNRDAARPERLRLYGLDRVYKFFVPAGADAAELAGRFAGIPGVEYAEPDYIGTVGTVVPDDPQFTDQWNLDNFGQTGGTSDADVDAPEAWAVDMGSGTIIAILDTGVASAHPDLSAPGKLLPGTDLIAPDDDPEDDHGHGTKVTSVASASTNNGEGIAGMCWDCRILPVKMVAADGSTSHSLATDAAVWATDHGARVINLSAGWFSGSSTLRTGVEYAYDAGVVYISITHNQDEPRVYRPASYAQTIAVGATDYDDHRVKPFCGGTGGSNYGPEIDVVAPGDDIPTARRAGGYGTGCGTSFAAPLVSGLVGVMESVYPSLGRDEARHLLHAAADDLVGRPTEDVAGFDWYHGWGRTNADRTLRATEVSITLKVDGGSATRLYFEIPNPLAQSYDFIRGELAALSETSAGVDAGAVVCLEDDSPDADTAGNEDTDVPGPGEAYYYLARFNAAPGAGSYGGSSQNRDRVPASGDCAN